ncbi:hypothetical protein [Neobacillus sp. NPDC093127]|uniref:hypothetical protein n=1 Tax=Neobacillus sp. NPDC093127 TaxID=3364296 RepID=UPI00382B20A0
MMKVKNYIGQFHPIVWVLLIGTVLSRGSAFMTLPFLSNGSVTDHYWYNCRDESVNGDGGGLYWRSLIG